MDNDPLLLGQRVVAILETGLRTATYKLATLMALIEHCIENLPEQPDDTLRVPLPALAHRVLEEPEVDLWHADIVDVNQASRTFDVRIREWRLLVSDVASNRLFKPSVSLPAV